MLKQNINIFIALAMVASIGIGASFLIIKVATTTDFSYISTDDSIVITAEIQKRGAGDDSE